MGYKVGHVHIWFQVGSQLDVINNIKLIHFPFTPAFPQGKNYIICQECVMSNV